MFATVSQFLAEAADKFALQVLETDRYFDAVGWALTKTERWHQRECPLKAPLVMWLILAGVFYRAESLKSILAKVLNQYRQESPGLPLDAVTPEAACKARQRLGVEPVAAVFRRLAEDVRGTISFKGLRLWSIDGTFLSVADEEANEAAFGRKASSRGKTAYPQVHVTQLCDTATRLVKDVVLGRCDRVSERRDALALIEHLGKGDLLLWDCGFSAVWFFHKCLQRNIHAIGRIGAGWNPTILKTISDGDYIVSVEGPIPKAHRSKRGTASVRLKLRMIVYQVGNDDPVRLLTTLLDPEQSTAQEIAVLYHERWESELVHDEEKVHMVALQHGKQKTVLRSKTPDGVRQEIYGMLIVYNLVRGLMVEAADIEKVNPRDLSFVETLRLIADTTPAYQQARSCRQRNAVRQQLLQDIAKTLNDRPRRPRHYPRVVKIKMSNYACKKPKDVGSHRNYLAELRLIKPSRRGSLETGLPVPASS